MSMTKIRGIIAGIFAVVLVIVMASVGAAMAGLKIPGLSMISDLLGVGK